MKILYTGTDKRCKEFEEKFSTSGIELLRFNFNEFNAINPKLFDAIFDLEFDNHPHRFELYAQIKNIPIILHTTQSTLLAQTVNFAINELSLIFGMTAFPTFIGRAVWEMTCLGKNAQEYFNQLKKNLQIEAVIVKDRVGMITPRVVFMIINEAYYTFQEGTASKEDIDIAMKLGTNYPFGPFDWAFKIGIKNVVETLEALYNDTHDERYKVCPLLKTEYQEQMALKTALLK
jgi:3-hydroxybutyryl-CoA dehydrogenase